MLTRPEARPGPRYEVTGSEQVAQPRATGSTTADRSGR